MVGSHRTHHSVPPSEADLRNAGEAMCPLCEGPARRLVRWREGYSIRVCRRCGVRFADPMPTDEELGEFYQGFLFRKPTGANADRRASQKQSAIRRAFGEKRAGARRVFLDYGGGTGAGTRAALALGYDVYYFDLDSNAAAYVRQNCGLADEHMLSDTADSWPAFDRILVDNVLEHVPDPSELVGRLHRALAPGGMAAFRTPRGGSTEALFYPLMVSQIYLRKALSCGGITAALLSLMRRVWFCDPPRHVWSFTPRSLRNVAALAGIPDGQYMVKSYGSALFQQSLLGLCISRPRSAKGVLLRLAVLPLVPLELIQKVLQVILAGLHVLSPSGLVLVVVKGDVVVQ